MNKVSKIIIVFELLIIIFLSVVLIVKLSNKKTNKLDDNQTSSTTTTTAKPDIISVDEIIKNELIDIIEDAKNNTNKYSFISEEIKNNYYANLENFKIDAFSKYNDECYDFVATYNCKNEEDESCFYRGEVIGEKDEFGYKYNGSVKIDNNFKIISISEYTCNVN